MADSVLGVLAEKLVTFIRNEAHNVHKFPGQLTKMKNEIQLIQGYLNNIDQVKKEDKDTIKMISQKLRELFYDAEDIIVDCELMFIKQQRQRASTCMICSSPSFLIFIYRSRKNLSQINHEIGSLRERMKAYLGIAPTLPNQAHVTKGSRQVIYHVLVHETQIVGLKDDFEKIMEWLLQARGPLMVIGIVGKGGIGKTTLAQKISNNNDVKRHFDHVVTVVVSHSFELKEIVKDMLRKLDMEEDVLMRDEHGLFQQLCEQLKGKYLLILDDVGTTGEGGSFWWESLKSALPQRDNGSCVIVTTRKEEVARSMGAIECHIYSPQLLNEEQSWLLFSKIAFPSEGGQCPNEELECIGREIVAQCNRLPLAIKVIGGMMLWKEPSLFEWERVSALLKNRLPVDKTDNLVPSFLQLSYEELPMHLKPCMLCFAAYPEDFEIRKDDVIYWWIGEGFVQGKDGKTAFEVGEEWLTELISRGLLQCVVMDDFENSVKMCRVHDMVHDMIVEIAKEENFMGLDDKGNPSLNIQSRRLCIMNTTIDGLFFSEDISKLMRMRTLFWRISIDSEFIQKLYKLKWLRVLVVKINECYEELDEWLSGIGSFPHLTYLKIENSRLETLPDSIANLRNLQVLCLYYCSNLKKLPEKITSLEKLTVLDILNCDSLKYYPVEMGKLSNLLLLRWFKPSCSGVGEGCRMSELLNLIKLTTLRIKIDLEDQIGEGELHLLSQLKELKYLSIRFKHGDRSGEEQKQLLRKVDYDLSPCQQLEELRIWNFPGETTPVWLNPTTLPNLQFLSITEGNMTHMHPSFFRKIQGENWKLEVLRLAWCEKLEEEWPRMESAMPFLRVLKVYRCPKLKLFPGDVGGYGGGIWRKEDKIRSKRKVQSNSLVSFVHRIISCVDCE